MNDREKFLLRAALIYLTSNLTDANQAFETASPHNVPEVQTISVNGDEGDVINETEINDLLMALQ